MAKEASVPLTNAPGMGGSCQPQGYEDSRPSNTDRKQSAK